MSLTSMAPTASKLQVQQVLASFETCPARQIVAYRNVLMADPYTSRSQALLISHIEEVIAADRRKDESLALLLHELRTPLASIQNAVAVLRLRAQDEGLQQRMQELIERQVRQIVLLMTSLSQASGARTAAAALQSLHPSLERIDLCSVLWKAAETMTPEYADRQQQLEISVPEGNVWVSGDASRLEQVFVNLLSNASKYSDPGGRILMSMQVCDGHAVVKVSDSGIGISPDSMPFIFDLFVRADAAAVRTRPGTGIGLALVRSILDSHQGTVSAASPGIGYGSEFTVSLHVLA